MANRYWVGGTGNWSDTNHWSYYSGGSGGATVPDSTKDVYVDSSSGFEGGGTITLTATINCHDFTSTSGDSYTITLGKYYFDVYGSLVLESGITWTATSRRIRFQATDAQTITCGGCQVVPRIDLLGTGSWTLQDDLTANRFYPQNGTFNANNHNVSITQFSAYADTGYTPTINMGSGTWTITGSGTFFTTTDEYSGEVVTINADTSTIKLITSETSNYYFESNKSFYNFWISGNTTGYTAISIDYSGSNSFNQFKIDAGLTVKFKEGVTQTVNDFVAEGTSGSLITLNSDNGSSQFTLSKSSGVVECDYLNLSNSNATGGATWYAGNNSADTTNNDGWIFEDKPTPLSPKVIVKNKLNLLSIGSL